jgi:hypothetical protein
MAGGERDRDSATRDGLAAAGAAVFAVAARHPSPFPRHKENRQ